MVRLDPLLPSQIQQVQFYSQNLFGCSILLTVLMDGKRWIVRFAIAKAYHILPKMKLEPEVIEAVDGVLCEIPISERRFRKFAANILRCSVEDWKKNYSGSLESNHWEMQIQCESGEAIASCGNGAYPSEFLGVIQAWDDLMLLNSIMQCMAMEPADFKRYGVAV